MANWWWGGKDDTGEAGHGSGDEVQEGESDEDEREDEQRRRPGEGAAVTLADGVTTINFAFFAAGVVVVTTSSSTEDLDTDNVIFDGDSDEVVGEDEECASDSIACRCCWWCSFRCIFTRGTMDVSSRVTKLHSPSLTMAMSYDADTLAEVVDGTMVVVESIRAFCVDLVVDVGEVTSVLTLVIAENEVEDETCVEFKLSELLS